eukprot:5110685-Amphidinium_carterae.2
MSAAISHLDPFRVSPPPISTAEHKEELEQLQKDDEEVARVCSWQLESGSSFIRQRVNWITSSSDVAKWPHWRATESAEKRQLLQPSGWENVYDTQGNLLDP